MKKTGFLFDKRFLQHQTGPYHPEVPERLEVIYRGLEQRGLLSQLTLIPARPAEERWIEAVHSIEHIRRFEEACLMGKSELDHPDNQICEETFQTALLAVGGILEAARRVMARELDNAFCAVRPPGHHAEVDQALGFCFFNNVAIAARYLQAEWGVRRVGIIDLTSTTATEPSIFLKETPPFFIIRFTSTRPFPYPGTGREFEKGLEAGYGYTLNSPVLPGYGDEEYRDSIEKDLVPAFDRFQPEVILVSAGFDAHEDDDMSNINLSTSGYSWIMNRVMELAERHAQGRLISILEGGYSLSRLPELTCNHMEILLKG